MAPHSASQIFFQEKTRERVRASESEAGMKAQARKVAQIKTRETQFLGALCSFFSAWGLLPTVSLNKQWLDTQLSLEGKGTQSSSKKMLDWLP